MYSRTISAPYPAHWRVDGEEHTGKEEEERCCHVVARSSLSVCHVRVSVSHLLMCSKLPMLLPSAVVIYKEMRAIWIEPSPFLVAASAVPLPHGSFLDRGVCT